MCPGGEIAFITRLIEESCSLTTRVALYSSLVGKKSSLRVLLRLLREKGVPSMGTGVLYQGRTCRWVLCWSFDPAFGTEMSKSPQTYKVLGHKKRADLAFHVSVSCEEAWARIRAFCRACGVSMVCVSELQGVCLREEECKVGQYVYRFPGCEQMGDGSEGVKDMEEKGKDTSEKGKDMKEEGKDMKEEGKDTSEKGKDMEEKGKDMKEEGKDMKEEVNNTSENGNDIECSFSIAVEEEEDTEVVLTLLVGAVEGGEA